MDKVRHLLKEKPLEKTIFRRMDEEFGFGLVEPEIDLRQVKFSSSEHHFRVGIIPRDRKFSRLGAKPTCWKNAQ